MSNKPIIEFDHHAPEFSEAWGTILDDLRSRCPVAWTNAHDGFWLITGAAEAHRVGVSPQSFSSARSEDDPYLMSLVIPKIRWGSPYPQIPVEVDPPDFYIYRRMLNPLVSPAAAKSLRPAIARWSNYFIDRMIERGACDLTRDFASPVPACVTLEWIGLPTDGWKDFSEAQHNALAYAPGSPEYERAVELKGQVFHDLKQAVEERREDPRDDVISYLVQQQIDGAPLREEVIIPMLTLLIGGGIETTASLVSSVLVHLDLFPEDRERLRADPGLIETATEEFLRVYPPSMGHARTAREDTEIGGCPIKKGDRVFLSWASANRDGNAFENPERVILDRAPNRHYSFGIGIHRCAGSHIARTMFKEMITQILARIPDYRVTDPASLEKYVDQSMFNGYSSIPATCGVPAT
jgi:cytochrome P450